MIKEIKVGDVRDFRNFMGAVIDKKAFDKISGYNDDASKNAKVRAFATMMIKDHQTSTAAVKAAAIKSGLKPTPPALEPKQAADLAALKQASGAARDTLYIAQQKAAHQEALALHKDNAAGSSAPALKAASAKIVPVVEHHLQELSGL